MAIKHVEFLIKGKGRTDTLRLPPEFIALCRDPHALDHLDPLDIDAVHRTDDARKKRAARRDRGVGRPQTSSTLARKFAADRERLADLYRSGMPLREIATELGTSIGTVGVALARLRNYGYDLPYRYSEDRRRRASVGRGSAGDAA